MLRWWTPVQCSWPWSYRQSCSPRPVSSTTHTSATTCSGQPRTLKIIDSFWSREPLIVSSELNTFQVDWGALSIASNPYQTFVHLLDFSDLGNDKCINIWRYLIQCITSTLGHSITSKPRQLAKVLLLLTGGSRLVGHCFARLPCLPCLPCPLLWELIVTSSLSRREDQSQNIKH